MRSRRIDTEDAIRQLLVLGRLERSAERSQWADLTEVREYVESLIGPTVRQADAARLLGISHPALKRWIDKGEISAVLTPGGTTEVPLQELLGLLEQLEEQRYEGDASRRPLARVIRERNRQATETVEINRLLPRRHDRGHRVAELQSLAYHRLVAERLDERLVAQARRRLERWRANGGIHPEWAGEWERTLSKPVPEIAQAISSDSKKARALRQTSPFAGVLTEQERRRLVSAVEERALA